MKPALVIFLSIFLLSFRGVGNPPVVDTVSPLSAFSSEWENPKYRVCNTAANVDYMTDAEKQVIYILNLARMDPTLFLNTVVKKFPEHSSDPGMDKSEYYRSLLIFLKHKKSQPLLYPEQRLYTSAECHAASSGETGYVGHTRRTRDCKKLESFSGECCHYGDSDPLYVVMCLLIDEDVPSLGHRLLLFDTFKTIGVSIQPHKKYEWNAVLDLGY